MTDSTADRLASIIADVENVAWRDAPQFTAEEVHFVLDALAGAHKDVAALTAALNVADKAPHEEGCRIWGWINQGVAPYECDCWKAKYEATKDEMK